MTGSALRGGLITRARTLGATMLRLAPGKLRLGVARVRLGGLDLLQAFTAPRRQGFEATAVPPDAAVQERRSASTTPPRKQQSGERQRRRRQRVLAGEHEWPTAPVGRTFRGRLSESSALLPLRDHRSLLSEGLEAGLDLPFSCGLGGCGACKCRLRSGEVERREPNCLDPEERAAGWILPCVARPLSDLELEA